MDYPDRIDQPGTEANSSAKRLGLHLRDALAQDPNFYLFSPDETTSNKVDAAYEASDRAWAAAPEKPWDKYMSPNGRVIELLSENTLFAMLAGHLITGGTGAFVSYEAFLSIITSQLEQHIKFIDQSKAIAWRKSIPALNILSTSTCWRQDHNGFSHQNPSLISTLLDKPSNLTNCLFPVDDIAASAAWEFAQNSKDVVNLITFNKTEEPRWIDINHARYQLAEGQGASIFQFASDPNPDIIITAAGDISSREALYAIQIIKEQIPEIKIRFVGIAALSYGAIGTTDNKLPQSTFDELFTSDKPIVANFHGYPEALQAILANYAAKSRLHIHGFIDRGSTTPPLDMLIRNQASRYDLAADVFITCDRPDLASRMQQIIQEKVSAAKQTGI